MPNGPRALACFALLAATACSSTPNGAGSGDQPQPGDTASTADAASDDARGPGDVGAIRGDASVEGSAETGGDARAPQGEAGATPASDAATPTQPVDASAASADAAGTLADASSMGVDAGHAGSDAGAAGRDASTTPGVDAAVDGSSTGVDSACVAALPAGWSLAAFDTTLASCPSGFSEHVVFGPPTVGAGACACTCSVTQPGGCGQGSLAMSTNPGHGNDSCTTPWFTATVNGPQCIAVPAAAQGALGNFEATALAATGQGGTCASAVQGNLAALSEPAQRFCDVPAASADAVCNGNVPGGLSACIVASGQVACPSSTPFVHAFTVEDGAVLACSGCSACTVSTSCSNPVLSAFTSAACSGSPALSFAVNGTCVTNPAEQTVLSVRYDSTTSATCAAGSSSGTAKLTGARTICCR